jgi:hypothetical protein
MKHRASLAKRASTMVGAAGTEAGEHERQQTKTNKGGQRQMKVDKDERRTKMNKGG